MGKDIAIAPGVRVRIRDAEWVIKRVDRSSDGGQALAVVGIDELVKDREAIFLSKLESNIEIVDPLQTEFVTDQSPYYRNSLLYMESLRRDEFNEKLEPVLKENLASLDTFRQKRFAQLDSKFEGKINQHRKEREAREIEKIFNKYQQWIKDTMTIEDNPYIRSWQC